MQKDLTNTTAIPRDGFDDYEDDNRSDALKGCRKIKFILEYTWVDRDDEVIDPERELIVLDVCKLLQKWMPGQDKPAVTKFLAANEAFPDVKELNDQAPRTEWQEKHGKMQGPWQNARAVYLLDPRTMERFVYINKVDTIGGDIAIRELRDATHLARRVRGGARVYPVVTLGDTFMPTKHGGRQRPDFKILRFETLGEQPAPAQIEHAEHSVIDVKVEPIAPTPRKKTPQERKLEKQIADLKAKLEAVEDADVEEEDGEDEALFETASEE